MPQKPLNGNRQTNTANCVIFNILCFFSKQPPNTLAYMGVARKNSYLAIHKY